MHKSCHTAIFYQPNNRGNIMTKTAFIAIVGRANVGKSTLLNALLGEKISIISKKPQTTRNRITGVLTRGENQFVFLDTPGMHNPKNKLGMHMVKAVRGAIASVDAAILVAEADFLPGEIEKNLLARLKQAELPVILALNKTDKSSAQRIGEVIGAYSQLCDFASVVPMCALRGERVNIVLDECASFMREDTWFFPEDALTDQPERQIAAEVIREKLLRLLDDELPHGVAVVIEEFRERTKESSLFIRAEIFCERESHKGMVIGKQGTVLKRVGSYAREDLEAFFGVKVFLDLWVKVKENWRDNDFLINSFGYDKE